MCSFIKPSISCIQLIQRIPRTQCMPEYRLVTALAGDSNLARCGGVDHSLIYFWIAVVSLAIVCAVIILRLSSSDSFIHHFLIV